MAGRRSVAPRKRRPAAGGSKPAATKRATQPVPRYAVAPAVSSRPGRKRPTYAIPPAEPAPPELPHDHPAAPIAPSSELCDARALAACRDSGVSLSQIRVWREADGTDIFLDADGVVIYDPRDSAGGEHAPPPSWVLDGWRRDMRARMVALADERDAALLERLRVLELCEDCGRLRSDGHRYDCSYWARHPKETPF